MIEFLKKFWTLAFPPAAPEASAGPNPFELPHSYQPELRLADGLIAVFAVMARIVLGCLLFATWGALSSQAWRSVEGPYWHAAIFLPMVAVLIAAFLGLMSLISMAVRLVSPR